MLTAVDSTWAYSGNPNGAQYCFNNVAPGSYRVKAALDPANPGYTTHIPTYYGNALQWNFAAVVSVCPSVSNTNITFVAGANPGGPGFIGGLVSQGANKTQNTALVGVTVILKDNTGQLISWTLTDANGAYSFPNLAYGTYHITVDALNLQASEKIVTLSAGMPAENNADVEMNLNPTSATQDLDLSKHFRFYPNPASTIVNVDYSDMPNQTELQFNILDISGVTVESKRLNVTESKGSVAFDVSALSEGLYIIQMTDSKGQIMHQKMSVIR
jgi:hypothetical protein